jgi:predicted DsbA family dithiol-disulfide isomerase
MGFAVRAKIGVLVLMLGGAGMLRAQMASSPATVEAERAQEPQAPAPHVAAVNPFPAVEAKNFTADSPTPELVNEFLEAMWGSNENRIWSVQAIQKTAAPGVVKVVLLLADKTQPHSTSSYQFFVTPDGKHAIADTMIDFGAKPFAERRKTLEEHADGPGQGAAGKELLVVEFGDLLNAKSREAHDKAAELARDFPQARWVYESVPAEGHPYAFRAAEEGVCVRKAKGDAAFFTYAQAVFDKQDGLTAGTAEATFGAAATEAGADAKAVAVCADTQAAKEAVKASVALAAEVGVDQAPSLTVNGRVLPLGTTTIEALKGIVLFQAKQDGIAVREQPSLSTLK